MARHGNAGVKRLRRISGIIKGRAAEGSAARPLFSAESAVLHRPIGIPEHSAMARRWRPEWQAAFRRLQDIRYPGGEVARVQGAGFAQIHLHAPGPLCPANALLQLGERIP